MPEWGPGLTEDDMNTLSSLLGGINILGLGLGAGVSSLLGLDKAFFIENNAGSLSLVPL